jgi:branched-chain amino acid transport system substrate-binding protein
MLGDNVSLMDAGIAALKASENPKKRDALTKSLSTLKVMTPVGELDFTKGPFPNVCPMIFAGTQWTNAKPGSKFKLDMIVTNNADDPQVPVGAQLVPYNG